MKKCNSFLAILIFILFGILTRLVAQESSLTDNKLIEAVENGDVNSVKKILESKNDEKSINMSLFIAISAVFTNTIGVKDFSVTELKDIPKEKEIAYIEIINLLFEKGADANALRYKGYEKPSIKKLGPGAKMYSTGKKGEIVSANLGEGKTALFLASDNGHLQLVNILLNNGAITDATDRQGQTPLHIACVDGHIEIVRRLLKNGSNVNAKRSDGVMALELASQEGYIDIVQDLLNHGANLNEDTNNSLLVASERGHTGIVKLLLDNGANVNSKSNGFTSLLLAAYYGHLDVVKLLVEKGADMNQKFDGKTALDAAKMNNHYQVVKFLEGTIGKD